MKADPILKELWEIKDGLAAECNHDLRRLFDRLKASQEDHGHRVVNRARQRQRVAEQSPPAYPEGRAEAPSGSAEE
jgi:hypothetical protein